MTDLSSIRQELEKSRRDVLDLSLRHPLLNFRPSKRRGIEVVDERSRELFRILVGGPVPDGSSSRSPRVMYFLPASAETALPATGEPATDHLDDIPSELLAMLGEPDDGLDEAAARHTDNKLQTALPRAALSLRLRETFRQARLSIEEQGVNILYLALGMLRWYESESSGTERRAPLILIPVQLDRSGVRESFKLRWAGDDIEANLSLEAKLKQDFGVRLPEMPAEEGLDVEDYLFRVGKAVARRERWAVEHDEVHLISEKPRHERNLGKTIGRLEDRFAAVPTVAAWRGDPDREGRSRRIRGRSGHPESGPRHPHGRSARMSTAAGAKPSGSASRPGSRMLAPRHATKSSGERRPRSFACQCERKTTRVLVRSAPVDPLPNCHNGLLDRHNSVEVGHEAAAGHSRDEAVVWPSTPLDLAEHLIIHFDQWANLSEWAISAVPDEVAGLSEDCEAADGCLSVLSSFDDRRFASGGQWVFHVGPIQKPVVPDDAVALTPSRDSLVDLLATGTVNRGHAAGPLRFERRVHAPVPDGHGRSSRRRARRGGGAYAQSGPPH